MMEMYAQRRGHLYILVRVFNLSGTPYYLRFFVNLLTHPDLLWGEVTNEVVRVKSKGTKASNSFTPES